MYTHTHTHSRNVWLQLPVHKSHNELNSDCQTVRCIVSAVEPAKRLLTCSDKHRPDNNKQEREEEDDGKNIVSCI